MMKKYIGLFQLLVILVLVCSCKSKSKTDLVSDQKAGIYLSSYLPKTSIGSKVDCSPYFQKALDVAIQSNQALIVENGAYFFAKTVLVRSNAQIIGKGNVRIKGKFNFPNAGEKGGYPTTIFTNTDHRNGNQNISFENIIFDGNRQNAIKNFTQQEPQANTLKFTRVQGLEFTNCQFLNHLSNIPSPYTDDFQAARNCVAVNIEKCGKVEFKSCKMEGIHNEAIWFYRSKDIIIDELESIGTRGISTHLSFWYCDGVELLNSKLTYELMGGSTVNCESSNVLIKNNQFIGGRGIDISNEAEFESFEPENVKIESNEIDVSIYGIVRRKGEAVLKNYSIINNKLRINGGSWLKKPWQVFAIRTDDTENTIIENNQIEFYNLKDGDFYIAIGATGNSEKDITIQKNKVVGVDCFYYATTHYGSKTNINILENQVYLNALRGDVNKGYSSGVYVYNMLYTKGNKGINGLNVESNLFENCTGDCITFLTRKPYKIDQVSVKGNTFEKKGKANNNGIRIEGAFSSDSKDLSIEDNDFKNIKIGVPKNRKGVKLARNKVFKKNKE